MVVTHPGMIVVALLVVRVRIQGDAHLPLRVGVQRRSRDPRVTSRTLRISLIVRPRSLGGPPVLHLVDPAETTRKDRQDPSDEGEPDRHPDLGRGAIDRVYTGLGDVEHGEVYDERCEGAGGGEPGEEGGETEEGDVVHRV